MFFMIETSHIVFAECFALDLSRVKVFVNSFRVDAANGLLYRLTLIVSVTFLLLAGE